MQHLSRTQHYGFSLVEVILSVALFGLLVAILAGVYLHGEESTFLAGNRMRATFLAEEGLEAVRNIKDEDFQELGSLSDGTYYLQELGGEWDLGGGSPESIDMYAREIEVASLGDNTFEVTSRVTWTQNFKRNGLVELVTRFVNWARTAWSETTQADFALGARNSVDITNVSGGEVQLSSEAAWTAGIEHLLYDQTAASDATALFQQGNTLWVARADGNLYELDISNISNTTITETATYSMGTATPTGLVISGDRAYISMSDGSSELVVVDLTGVASPVSVDMPGAVSGNDVAFGNSKVIVARDETGAGAELVIYDASGSTVEGTVEVGADVYAVRANDSYAFLGTADVNEIWVVDINDCTGGVSGTDCTIDTQYSFVAGGNSAATALELVGDNLYAGRDNGYIHGFAVSGSSISSEFLSFDDSNDRVNDLAVDESDNMIFVASDDAASEEIHMYDITTPATPIGYAIDAEGGANAYAVEKQGEFLYIASGDDSEVQVYATGLSGGWASPQLVDTYDTSGGDNANDVFIDGDYAYLATDDDLWVFDISDPSNVTLEDGIDFNFDINDVYVSGSYAYLATDSNTQELVIVDVSNPASISEVGSYNADSNANGMGVWVSGTTVYLVTTNNNGGSDPEFYVLSAIPEGLVVPVVMLGGYDVGNHVADVQVDGTIAYLSTASNSQELVMLNVAVPALVTLAGSYNKTGTGDAYGLWYQDDTVYLVTDDGGADEDFFVIDVTTPGSAALLASYDTGHTNRDVRVSGSYAFVANDEVNQELLVLNISAASSGVITEVGNFDANGNCNGLDTDGTYVYLACSNNNNELVVVEEQASSSGFSFEGWFTSAAFDSGASGAVWDELTWTESGMGDITLQLRTAPDAGGNPGTWTDWLGPAGTGSSYSDPNGGTAIISTHADGSSDQWIQYRASLTGDGSTTPVLESVTVTYSS